MAHRIDRSRTAKLKVQSSKFKKSFKSQAPKPPRRYPRTAEKKGARTALSARYFGEMIEPRGHGCPRSVRDILEPAVQGRGRTPNQMLRFFAAQLAA